MPALKNKKYERVVLRIFSGEKPRQAFIDEGFSEKTADQGVSRLLKRPEVQLRLVELREQVDAKSVNLLVEQQAETRNRQENIAIAAIEQVVVTREYVLAGLKENHQRAMQAEPVLDSKGKETGDYTYAGAVANRALELLGKEIGMFVEKSQVTQNYATLEEFIAAQPAEIRAKWLAQLEAKGVKPEVVQ